MLFAKRLFQPPYLETSSGLNAPIRCADIRYIGPICSRRDLSS